MERRVTNQNYIHKMFIVYSTLEISITIFQNMFSLCVNTFVSSVSGSRGTSFENRVQRRMLELKRNGVTGSYRNCV